MDLFFNPSESRLLPPIRPSCGLVSLILFSTSLCVPQDRAKRLYYTSKKPIFIFAISANSKAYLTT